MADVLYTLIIYPIEKIIECVYLFAYRVFRNPGLAILCVSGAVTLLCLPLYIRAEKWQNIEREIRRKLEPKVKKIKAVFKGDEQYMIMSTYYRQNHYHPLMALRSSFSLLIQIPFFIAAYSFLSHLESLKGVSFYFIQDLGKSDALLHIGSISINILPIVMTAINIAAGTIYTKGFAFKDKLQLYGMALIFLVLLYPSPAGLVLYWTLNNIFSLIKNIMYKIKKPLRMCSLLALALGVVVNFYLLCIKESPAFQKRMLLASVIMFVITAPILLYTVYKAKKNKILNMMSVIEQKVSDKCAFLLFIFSMTCLFLLIGTVLPSNVIVASTQEFSCLGENLSPFYWLQKTTVQAAGLFLFWPLCVFCIFSKRLRKYFAFIGVCTAVCATVNVFFFPGDYGLILNTLIFPNGIIHSTMYTVLSVCANLIVCVLLFFVLFKKQEAKIVFLLIIAAIGFTSISTVNSVHIYTDLTELEGILAANKLHSGQAVSSTGAVQPIFHLSKTGKNVFVIMLDRAISAFIPDIFNESPELYSQYSGFTYYPNTVSFGMHTNVGSPGIFGGYDYTPAEINKRSDTKLVQKHNEALLFMPLLFQKSGFEVTVSDLPYSNYSLIPDLSMYKPYNIRAYNTEGNYVTAWSTKTGSTKGNIVSVLSRNFLFYSIMRCSLPVFRPEIYNQGSYWSVESPRNNSFINSYSVLDLMKDLTSIQGEGNTLTLFANNTPHNSAPLQPPDYIPSDVMVTEGTSALPITSIYATNAAAIKRLGVWLDYLQANDVYDNTRIILVSDHGYKLDLFPKLQADIPYLANLNALLMVKDFYTEGSLKTDHSFMTNADVPFLATKEIISNPQNPFTGTEVTMDAKLQGVVVTTSNNWSIHKNNGTVFNTQAKPWYKVHSDIFDFKNWSVLTHE